MDKYDIVARLVDWLAMPLVYFLLLLMFLLFVVRPFFAYLFNPDRIIAIRKLRSARQQAEEAERETPDKEEGEEEFHFNGPPGLRDNQQQIDSLAKSNPDKAGNLIREWLKQDQS